MGTVTRLPHAGKPPMPAAGGAPLPFKVNAQSGKDIFTAEVRAILDDYFGNAAPSQDAGDLALQNAVARIALSGVQRRLPNCAVFDGDGDMELTRQPFKHRGGRVSLLAKHLFTINWADTAPGISWPEAYYVTFIPGYDRHIVTGAMDSPDVHGYSELALGSFDRGRAVEAGAHDVLTGWWAWQHNSWDQERWAYVWNDGIIASSTADGWADEVWREEVEPDDES